MRLGRTPIVTKETALHAVDFRVGPVQNLVGDFVGDGEVLPADQPGASGKAFFHKNGVPIQKVHDLISVIVQNGDAGFGG